ncbi:MAG TPA: ankyrin repeat domain-containing protein [Chthonomonadaceae bacterium]|nr:ankyrin repeat domain-containing protein [Chthonomonadaceae bacterium]
MLSILRVAAMASLFAGLFAAAAVAQRIRSNANGSVADGLRRVDADLLVAIQGGSSSALSRALAKGASPLATDPFGHSALWLAADLGEVGAVRQLAARLPADRRRRKALGDASCQACRSGHDAAAIQLISAGAQIDFQDQFRRSPLMYAAEVGASRIVSMLVKRGAKLDLADNAGETALEIAAMGGKNEAAGLLIAAGASVDHHSAQTGPALIDAVITRNDELVRLLLTRGAHANVHGYGGTALYFAANGGQRDLVMLLLSKGADPSVGSSFRDLPLAGVAGEGGMALATMGVLGFGGVITNEKRETALARAASDDVAIATALIDHGAKLKSADGTESALLLAVSGGGYRGSMDSSTKLVELLLQRGGSVADRDFSGRSALHNAAQSGNPATTALLLTKGADPQAATDEGETPLMALAAHGRNEIAIRLEDLRAAVLHRANEGAQNPVDPAVTDKEQQRWNAWAASGDAATAKALTGGGAKLDIQDRLARTALFLAAEHGSLPVVQALVAAGANVAMPNRAGVTPLRAAIAAHRDEVADLLRRSGAGAAGR